MSDKHTQLSDDLVLQEAKPKLKKPAAPKAKKAAKKPARPKRKR